MKKPTNKSIIKKAEKISKEYGFSLGKSIRLVIRKLNESKED